MDPKKEVIKAQIAEIVRFYQGIILDSVEQSFGEHPDWFEVRRRVLRAFGDRGLSSRLIHILTEMGVL